jgi:hypothetical protein
MKTGSKMNDMLVLPSVLPVVVAVGFCVLAYRLSYAYEKTRETTTYINEAILQEELAEIKEKMNRKCASVSDEAHEELESALREMRCGLEMIDLNSITDRVTSLEHTSNRVEAFVKVATESIDRIGMKIDTQINALSSRGAADMDSLLVRLEHAEKLLLEAKLEKGLYQAWTGSMKEKDLSITIKITRKCLATKAENLQWVESSAADEVASRDVLISIHDVPTSWSRMTQVEGGIQLSKYYWNTLWTGGIVVNVDLTFPKVLITDTAGLQFNMDLAKEQYPAYFPQPDTGILPIVGPAHLQAKRVSLEVLAKEILRKAVTDGKIVWTRCLVSNA